MKAQIEAITRHLEAVKNLLDFKLFSASAQADEIRLQVDFETYKKLEVELGFIDETSVDSKDETIIHHTSFWKTLDIVCIEHVQPEPAMRIVAMYCPKCQELIGDTVKTCAHCGYAITTEKDA